MDRSSVRLAKTPRFVLRDAVMADHMRTEAVVEAAQVFAHPDHYTAWLRAMYALHLYAAPCVDGAAQAFGLPLRSAAHLAALETDIAIMQGQTAHGVHPVAQGVPVAPVSLDAQIGVAYVIEGSGLGAQVLVRRAQAADGLSHHYLTMLCAEIKTRWPAFVTGLEAQDLDLDVASAAARQTFGVLQDALHKGQTHVDPS